jgi:hypothetical protein
MMPRSPGARRRKPPARCPRAARWTDYTQAMHFDAHQPVINDLRARILTIRDSL